jgi:hypothetical protein
MNAFSDGELTTGEVTAVSRNSGTRRIREDTQGHVQGANQVQEDTGGPAGILKDTSLRRFGTVRPGSNPGPPTKFRAWRIRASGSEFG